MSVVYVIAANESGPCKIGHAQSAVKRLKEIQTGNPQKLALCGVCPTDNALALENAVHSRLAQSNMSGEWFGVPVQMAWQAVVFEFMAAGKVAPLPVAEARVADGARSSQIIRRKEYLKLKARERRAAERLGLTIHEYRTKHP